MHEIKEYALLIEINAYNWKNKNPFKKLLFDLLYVSYDRIDVKFIIFEIPLEKKRFASV